jgi:hypothetical protein
MMIKRVAGLTLSSLIAGILMNSFSFLLIERKSIYDTAFDPNQLRGLSYEQGVRYAADHTVELTGLDTVRAGKDDKVFWETEIAYVLTYTIAGALGCTCYAMLRRRLNWN